MNSRLLISHSPIEDALSARRELCGVDRTATLSWIADNVRIRVKRRRPKTQTCRLDPQYRARRGRPLACCSITWLARAGGEGGTVRSIQLSGACEKSNVITHSTISAARASNAGESVRP